MILANISPASLGAERKNSALRARARKDQRFRDRCYPGPKRTPAEIETGSSIYTHQAKPITRHTAPTPSSQWPTSQLD
jgi:hypothetical protein